MSRITLRNGAPLRSGASARVRVGATSGGDPSMPARIGFDGAPSLGSGAFRCTIQNVRGGSLCGLMWGPAPQPGIASVNGFELHVLPQHFGDPLVASNAGFAAYELPIPATPALVGDAGCFQFQYYDPAIGAFGATQATQLHIGA